MSHLSADPIPILHNIRPWTFAFVVRFIIDRGEHTIQKFEWYNNLNSQHDIIGYIEIQRNRRKTHGRGKATQKKAFELGNAHLAFYMFRSMCSVLCLSKQSKYFYEFAKFLPIHYLKVQVRQWGYLNRDSILQQNMAHQVGTVKWRASVREHLI